ncbi:IS1182 family transposase [Rhodoferax ferrireducens]|uniref:IS1182 family transposase n=1 Tax=Rhodoferax ferrireducens TaxID=192843 RepID=UPI000E0D6CB4|nr:IS1182 family transposase [Rhodoferax ferrireducens]
MTTPTDRNTGRAEAGLFEDLPQPSEAQVQQAQAKAASKRGQGAPRLLQPNRSQIELRASDLESLLAQDHRARLVWGYVVHQDLSKLIEEIKARGGSAGRAAIDPRILFALWLYATLDGVGSGREVARLSQEHDAYRWICGGVSVNYHALNDFRAGNVALMDELLTDNVAALAAVGAISLERVAQNGMRVRADAGAASFRRQASLDEHLKEAGELVQTLKTQAQSDPGQPKRQAQAAQLRAAQEREERIRAALKQLPEVAATKKHNGAKAEDARASTTDADARVMKMGDGGFRPAFNVQFATTCEEQVIVGMDVVNAGSDMAQLAPMLEQVEQRLGQSPDEWLVDGGFPAHEQIDAVAGKTEVYAPVPEPKARKDGKKDATTHEQGNEVQQDKPQPKPGDSEALAQWRARMASDEAKEIYKQRAATAECVNAQARNRGLLRMPVRGLAKVRSVVGLFVLAHNLMRTAVLAPQLIGWRTSPCAMAAQAA